MRTRRSAKELKIVNMKYTNAALILLIASTSPYSSDAMAYIFAHINNSRVRETTRINDTLYAGYCVGCATWNSSSSIDASRRLNECKDGKMSSTAAQDVPIRRVRELADELPTHMMEMEPPAEDFTVGTEGLTKSLNDANLDEEDHSYIRQFIASILLFGVAATSYVLWSNTEKRNKLAIKTPKKGLEITIPTDLPPDLACATPMSTEDEVQESEEMSTLREENQTLQDKLAYYTAMERSYNNKSITSNPNDSEGKHNILTENRESPNMNATATIQTLHNQISVGKHNILTENRESPNMNATATIQTLHNQIEDLKEELKETNERLRNAINTNIALNDAHDREHQKLIILQKEMELSWEKFEETYRAQHEEMQKAEARVRNLLRENKDLKSSNKDLALKLSRRKPARA